MLADLSFQFGRSAFYMAVMQNLYLVCKVLKEEFGANPFLTDQLGRNAIHICWDVKLLRYLINSLGFDPNQTDLDGQTPFICAVKTNNLQICELLSSEFKCNIEAKDKVRLYWYALALLKFLLRMDLLH
jgi:ankyrin repeat protein